LEPTVRALVDGEPAHVHCPVDDSPCAPNRMRARLVYGDGHDAQIDTWGEPTVEPHLGIASFAPFVDRCEIQEAKVYRTFDFEYLRWRQKHPRDVGLDQLEPCCREVCLQLTHRARVHVHYTNPLDSAHEPNAFGAFLSSSPKSCALFAPGSPQHVSSAGLFLGTGFAMLAPLEANDDHEKT
jgi:hypothetical protein